ncbi:MAG: phosphatase PAP2 family protein [Gemmatimonadaceae bacterium]|nr:phosphatase PAP2 family protein [Chitinophagaceae bacterium]
MFFLQVHPQWFNGIDAIDKRLFYAINTGTSNNFFDALLPFVRESTVWAPLYLFFLIFAVVNFGKKGWVWFLFGICTAAIGDIVSSRLIKENIFRLRPCRDPEISDAMNFLVTYCPQSSGFTSSHATNHFGMAVFIVSTLSFFTGKWIRLIFLWAFVVCYAQVYVGVHYPLDVICGGLLGALIGTAVAKVFNNYVGLSSLQIKPAR